MAIIENGSGVGGYSQKVGPDLRAWVDSVSITKSEHATINGRGYNINTGIINLSGNGTKSAVLYLKNTGTTNIVISTIIYLLGNTTSGTGDSLFSVIKNPTGGTIIDNQVVPEMDRVNRNFGSPKTLTAVAYKGVEGDTLTGGKKILESIFTAGPARSPITVNLFVLPQGQSIGIEYTTPSGNSSQNVEVAISLHEEE